MTLTERLEQDPLWQQTKLKTRLLKTGDKTLSKIEYLRAVGHQNFTHQGYSKYLESRKLENSITESGGKQQIIQERENGKLFD